MVPVLSVLLIVEFVDLTSRRAESHHGKTII